MTLSELKFTDFYLLEKLLIGLKRNNMRNTNRRIYAKKTQVLGYIKLTSYINELL